MNNVTNIRELKMKRNPDYFIDTVLNDPARLARVKSWREEQIRKAKEQEKLEAERTRRAEMDLLAAKVAVIAGGIGFAAALVGFL